MSAKSCFAALSRNFVRYWRRKVSDPKKTLRSGKAAMFFLAILSGLSLVAVTILPVSIPATAMPHSVII
jgi:hypothetical protein